MVLVQLIPIPLALSAYTGIVTILHWNAGLPADHVRSSPDLDSTTGEADGRKRAWFQLQIMVCPLSALPSEAKRRRVIR